MLDSEIEGLGIDADRCAPDIFGKHGQHREIIEMVVVVKDFHGGRH